VGSGALPCDDANGCTTDSCDKVLGCQSASTAGSCSDGNGCTENDACASGSCSAGPAKSCNDSDDCTTDACDATSGQCQHTAIVGCGTPTWSKVYTQVLEHCTGCHGNAGGLSFGPTAATAYSALVNQPVSGSGCKATMRVKPGNPLQSLLYLKLAPNADYGCGGPMPPGPALSTGQIQLLKDWIDAGAPP
jgi:hypothetical protein